MGALGLPKQSLAPHENPSEELEVLEAGLKEDGAQLNVSVETVNIPAPTIAKFRHLRFKSLVIIITLPQSSGTWDELQPFQIIFLNHNFDFRIDNQDSP